MKYMYITTEHPIITTTPIQSIHSKQNLVTKKKTDMCTMLVLTEGENKIHFSPKLIVMACVMKII